MTPPRSFKYGERWMTVTVSDGAGWSETQRYRLLGPNRGDSR